MKTTFLFAAVSLACVAAQVQNDHRTGKGINRAAGNHNNNNGGFGNGNNGKNGGRASNSTSTAAGSASSSAAGAANTSAAGAGAGTDDPQASLTLDPKVIASGFANNGQEVPAAGQVASLTSTNNFINFCLTVPNLPITNGKQIATGSCNPAPMGVLPSSSTMPSAKFVFPSNGDSSITPNEAFTIKMAIQNFESGNFVNADTNYFSAPQQVNAQGQIIGHSHVVVERLTALDQTTPTDPTTFAFFKGLNAAAVGGILTADVTAGLPAGFYKLSSINSAANHQPVLVPIAQHGSLDDAVYFTITDDVAGAANATASASATAGAASGAAAGAAAGAAGASAAAAASAPAAASASAATAAPAKAKSAAPAASAASTKAKGKRFHARALY